MKSSLIFLLGICLAFGSQAQITPLSDSIADDYYQQITATSAGDLFLVNRQGDVVRNTDRKLSYSPVRKGRLTLLNVSNPLRPFLFYQDLQEYVILDRFLTESARYPLNDIVTFAALCAPSLNNQIWVVDMTTFTLIKYNPQLGQKLINVPLQQIMEVSTAEFIDLTEYRNYLFLTEKHSGIYIFDNMGNFLRKIGLEIPLPPAFYQDDLFFLQDKVLIRQNIYSGKQEHIRLPTSPDGFTINDRGLWILEHGSVRHYSF